MLYDIYAGLGGGFGGATFQVTEEHQDKDWATKAAYDLAVEIYQSYEGMHGILCWDECKEILKEEYGESEITDEDVDDYYREEVEGWIEYYTVEHDDKNPPEEE